MENILSVKLDFIFKLLFGDEKNKDILANFLSAVLEMPVSEFEEIQLLDTSLKRRHEGDKLAVLDVNLRISSGMLINLEIQIINKSDYENRSVYYTCKRLVDQLGEGDPYTKLNRTVSINITDFDLFNYEKYHGTYQLMERTEGTLLTDVIRIDFLELPKASRSKDKDIKRLWMDFLNAETEEEVKMLAQKSEVFQKPAAEIIRISGNEEIRAEYEARQKAIRDKIAEIEYGKKQGLAEGLKKGMEKGLEKGMEKGLEKGLEKGIKEGMEKGITEGLAKGERAGKISVAKNMKRSGIPLSQIAQFTGLSPEEIDEIEKL